VISKAVRPMIVAVPIGDVNGIGPEVAVKAALEPLQGDYVTLLVGSAGVVWRVLSLLGMAEGVRVKSVTEPEEVVDYSGVMSVLDVGSVSDADVCPGIASEKAGKASLDYIRVAAGLAVAGRVDAIACAPANKEAMRLAGSPFGGQTEFIASITGTREVGTVLVAGEFRVFQATGHVPLRQACDMVTEKLVVSKIRTAREVLVRDFGIEDPLIAVCGLNPHSGDGGVLGSEEQDHIIPAIERARKEGIRVDGPLPGDTAFRKVKHGGHDGVVAMYHDQANTVLKYAFSNPVTVTTGLRFARTTVGHGTAFDIAWKGIADPGCMKEAIDVAAQLSRVRKTRGTCVR